MLNRAGVGVAALLVSVSFAQAGPCTAEITTTQAAIDAKIEAIAGSGKDAAQSIRAQLGEQPTPELLARAEAALGEATNSQKALLLLARARILDRADNPGCKAVVEQSRQLLAQ